MTKNQVIRAVIFDLDGTIVDSEPIHYLGEKQLLAEYGVTQFDPETKKPYIGKSTESIMKSFQQKYHLNASLDVLVEQKIDRYLQLARKQMDVFPEMRLFIELLHKASIPLAVASGSSLAIIKEILALTTLEEFFTVVVSAEEVAKGKPAPDVFLRAAADLAVPPQYCLVIEDSQYGVEAAVRGHMQCIAIPYLSEPPLDPIFSQANLLFAEGMNQFSAQQAFDWIKQES